VDSDGERHVITPSTLEYGPPRYSVTWDALATLAMLTGQFAMPLNRLGTMLSSPQKRFTAASLGRMLHYVAQRFVPIYLELGTQLSGSIVSPCFHARQREPLLPPVSARMSSLSALG
jgi:hypothetical protein